MAGAKAISIDDYLAGLTPERRKEIETVRTVVRKNLPKGYVEVVRGNFVTYEIPLERYPTTYNKQPLQLAALAAQKSHNALYLMSAYVQPELEARLRDGFKAAGKKLDMGKSCIRFQRADDLDLRSIADVVSSVSPDAYIKAYELSRGGK
jgi:uncharacterized protein YdhG (YjbR/CyaY superfamily)